MFFAETLGPALTPASGTALFDHVRKELGADSAVSPEELRQAVAEFLRRTGNSTTPEAAIQFLAARGRIAASGAKYRLAA